MHLDTNWRRNTGIQTCSLCFILDLCYPLNYHFIYILKWKMCLHSIDYNGQILPVWRENIKTLKRRVQSRINCIEYDCIQKSLWKMVLESIFSNFYLTNLCLYICTYLQVIKQSKTVVINNTLPVSCIPDMTCNITLVVFLM